MSWGPPHDPYIAPEEYLQRFPADKIQLRENVDDFGPAEDLWNACDTALPERHQKRRRSYLPTLKDPENRAFKEWYRGYYAAIAVLDDCLGGVLQTLEETGLLDNTLIVFTADHGDNLGSHRQVGKQMPFEESISIPFLMRYPRKIQPGTVTDALLAPVDVMPTILSLADIPCGPVDGKDVSGAAMGRDEQVQDAVLLMRLVWLGNNWITNGSGPWRGVRTKRYTYARKSDTREPWLLFDNEQDPYQLNNLVDLPSYAELVKTLNKKTDDLLEKARDPEDPLPIARRIFDEHQQHKKYIDQSVLFPRRIEPGSGI
jgi:arylsulfatase A-like enzyme